MMISLKFLLAPFLPFSSAFPSPNMDEKNVIGSAAVKSVDYYLSCAPKETNDATLLKCTYSLPKATAGMNGNWIGLKKCDDSFVEVKYIYDAWVYTLKLCLITSGRCDVRYA
jgi:hypothetical protein